MALVTTHRTRLGVTVALCDRHLAVASGVLAGPCEHGEHEGSCDACVGIWNPRTGEWKEALP